MKTNFQKTSRKISKTICALGLIATALSCENEKVETNIHSEKPITYQNFDIKNKTLVFENNESLSALLESFKNDDDRFDEYLTELSAIDEKLFTALTPSYDIDNEVAIALYAKRKDKEYKRLASTYGYTDYNKSTLEIDDEDSFIADPHFAALLNEDHEVVVGETLYKYMPFGVFSGSVKIREKIKEVISDFNPDFKVYKTNSFIDLGDGVSYFAQDYMGELSLKESYQFPSQELGDTKTFIQNKTPDLTSFPLCSDLRKSLLNKIVGPSIDCTQYWERRKRIKTKVWNQNYALYSSIGISVRSQSRRGRVWWAKKTDELILGYNTVTFDYPWDNPEIVTNNPSYFPQAYNYKYLYKGQVVDQYGNGYPPTGGTIWNTTAFPITTVNDDWLRVQVYVPIVDDNIGRTVSTSDLNVYAESALKSAIKKFINGLQRPTNDTPMVMEVITPEKVRFVHHNWKKRVTNKAKIIENFDWNTAQIGVTLTPGGGGGLPAPDLKATAKSYNYVRADVYGIGRRGGTWKGSRIDYEEK